MSANSYEEDALYGQLRSEALHASQTEPALACLLSRTILHPSVDSFSSAVACSVSHRLSNTTGSQPDVCPDALNNLLMESLASEELEAGHTMAEAVRMDAEACVRRDPACESLLEVVLFYKGYAALVLHRAARRKWKKALEGGKESRFASLWLQSQASAAFGVDIHPAASIGAGVVFDHGTGVVVGETATVGDGCTLLHGVTLGGTGKEAGDRHPKVGNDVLLGANASVLGNVRIGDGAKIGAGSIVLKPIPSGATAVGAPAKIIGWAREKKPGSNIDMQLLDVVKVGGGSKGSLESTASTLSETTSEEVDESEDDDGVDGVGVDADGGDAGGDKNTKDNDGLIGKLIDSDHPEEELGEKKHEHPDEPTGQHTKKARIVHTTSWAELCPWRHFHEASNAPPAPPGSITKRTLETILKNEGCTPFEFCEVYSALLRTHPSTANLGYIPPEVFREEFVGIASTATRIPADRCEAIAQGAWNVQALKKREREYVDSIVARNISDPRRGTKSLMVGQMESLKPTILA